MKEESFGLNSKATFLKTKKWAENLISYKENKIIDNPKSRFFGNIKFKYSSKKQVSRLTTTENSQPKIQNSNISIIPGLNTTEQDQIQKKEHTQFAKLNFEKATLVGKRERDLQRRDWLLLRRRGYYRSDEPWEEVNGPNKKPASEL